MVLPHNVIIFLVEHLLRVTPCTQKPFLSEHTQDDLSHIQCNYKRNINSESLKKGTPYKQILKEGLTVFLH